MKVVVDQGKPIAVDSAGADRFFINGRSSWGFRDDKLYRFINTSVQVMAGWPRMLAWKRSARRMAWRSIRPDIFISLKSMDECTDGCEIFFTDKLDCRLCNKPCFKPKDPCVRWSNLIPMEIREIVTPFRSRHWHLLSMAARCGAPSVDLMASNPALAWALASSWVFRSRSVKAPMRSIRSLLSPGRSQRDILSWLDFPSSESARRQLAKIESKSIGVNKLLSLRDAMRTADGMKMLSHLPRINWDAIRMISDDMLRPYVGMRLLEDVSNCEELRLMDYEMNTTTAMLMQDCLPMMDDLGMDKTRLRQLRSRDDVKEFHDDLVHRSTSPGLRQKVCDMRVLAEPPFSGNDYIVPLNTEFALDREGIEMQHCVGSYGAFVRRGSIAVYKVLSPERATLSLERSGKVWRIREIKCKANADVSDATRAFVSAWLRRSSQSGTC